MGGGRLFVGTVEVEPVGQGTYRQHQASAKDINIYP